MGNMLGKSKPLKEVLRENKRQITRSIRELDREKLNLEREEKRLTMEIKKAAKDNQMTTVKIMAKDLVRTRQHITKMVEMRSHLQGCALKMQTVSTHHAMADALRNTAASMAKINKAVNIPTITKMMAEFEKENMRAEMMQDVMGDAIDDALEGEDNEQEEEQIVNQVLDEIGVTFGEELPEAGTNAVGVSTNMNSMDEPTKVATPLGGGGGSGTNTEDDPALSELEARLNNLKR